MSLSKVEQVKIVVEIDRLVKEAEKLEKEAQESENSYVSAFSSYGICPSNPPSDIKTRRQKAQLLREEAALFKKIIGSEVGIESIGEIVKQKRLNLVFIDEAIKETLKALEQLKVSKQLEEMEMVRLKKLQNLLS